MSVKIAISGSAGTGKSTLARALAARLDLPYLEEGFRRRREAGFDPRTLSRDQLRGLVTELYDEYVEAMDIACKAHGGFVADRSPVDYFAFWLHYGFWGDEELTDDFAQRYMRDAKRVDLTVVLPWGALPIEEDGIRSTNKWLQLKYQALLEGLMRREEISSVWIEPTCTQLSDRSTVVLKTAARM